VVYWGTDSFSESLRKGFQPRTFSVGALSQLCELERVYTKHEYIGVLVKGSCEHGGIKKGNE